MSLEHATLFGSCANTSAVLYMPCTEHALTSNCSLQKHSFLTSVSIPSSKLSLTISINLLLLCREIPIRNSPVALVFPYQDVNATNHMAKHRIPNQNHPFKASQDFTNLLCRKPSHVAVSRYVRCIISDSTARGHGFQH
jgi:hypothetical protein